MNQPSCHYVESKNRFVYVVPKELLECTGKLEYVFDNKHLNKYFSDRLPSYISNSFSRQEYSSYLNTRFTFRREFSELKISIGDLVCKINVFDKMKIEGVPMRKMFKILDWFIVHKVNAVDLNPGCDLVDLYKKMNMFHDCIAVEREFLNAIVNKGFKKREIVALTNIKLFTTRDNDDIIQPSCVLTAPSSHMLFDKDFVLTRQRENAKYIIEYCFVEGSVAKLVKICEDSYFSSMPVSLSPIALKSTLIIDFILKNKLFKACDSVEAFTTIMANVKLEKIVEFIKISCAYPEFLEDLSNA
jgi:hypothetical protein